MTPPFTAAEAAQWTGGAWDPAPPAGIAGVSNDSRTIRPGNLYVAIKGPRFDGHDFLADAFARGAAAAMVERDRALPSASRQAMLRVDSPLDALRRLAAGYRAKLAPLIIAVAGSTGKSTVKEMTARVLSASLKTACTRGNWNNEIGLPLSLLAMEPGTQAGVFELGISHPGEMRPLCEILRPAWGVVTNAGPAHIEFFGTVEAIAREKAVLLECLPRDGFAAVNADTPCFDVFRAAAACPLATVSMEHDADYRCLKRDPATNEFTIRERNTGQTVTVRVGLPGVHNAANALLAAAVARRLDVSWDRIGEALATCAGLPMRWEEKRVRGVRVINDAYNANPVSVRAALRTFAEDVRPARRWLVLGGMLELGAASEEEHRALGAFVAGSPWAGLITVGALGRLIADGAESAGLDARAVWRCDDPAQAAGVLRECVAEGDAVLLKGSRAIRMERVLECLVANQEA